MGKVNVMRGAGRQVIALGLMTFCAVTAVPGGQPGGSFKPRHAGKLGPDVAVAWFDLLYDLIRSEKLTPPVASRAIGFAGVTLYEAVVPGIPDHQSLAGQLNELPPLPATQPGKKYHWPSVANSAMAAITRSLLPAASAASLSKIDALEQQLAADYESAVPATVYDRSVSQGQAVAGAVATWAGGDDAATFNNCPFTPPVGPGLWVPTPPALKPALQPCWGDVRPFVLVSGEECAPPAPPAYSTDADSEFYAQGREVYDTVTHLTTEQRDIALFWSDDPGNTGTPPGHWISITGQVAASQGLSLATAAEAYARVGIAVADGFISCWHVKFVHNLLRPITYINATIDPAWLPLLTTPAFPEYTSGHSVQSGAAALVLGDLLGAVPFTDDTHHALGLAPRSFSSFEQAAREAALSRLYGGIHYRAAIDLGVEQGQCIGRTIVDHVKFLKDDDRD